MIYKIYDYNLKYNTIDILNYKLCYVVDINYYFRFKQINKNIRFSLRVFNSGRVKVSKFYYKGLTGSELEQVKKDKILLKEEIKNNYNQSFNNIKNSSFLDLDNETIKNNLDILLNEKKDISTDEDKKKRDYKYNISMRAKNKVFELVENNTFNYFLTVTFDNKKIDRSDNELILKKLLKVFNNFKNKYCREFYFLIVPEYHKNNNIHFHGLIYLPPYIINNKKMFKKLYIDDKTLTYRWNWLFNSFGANNIKLIYNSLDFCKYYITKYILKNVKERPCKKHYYRSACLSSPNVLYNNEYGYYLEDYFLNNHLSPTYNNENKNYSLYELDSPTLIYDLLLYIERKKKETYDTIKT